jgi:hypothetical protein
MIMISSLKTDNGGYCNTLRHTDRSRPRGIVEAIPLRGLCRGRTYHPMILFGGWSMRILLRFDCRELIAPR